MNPPTPHRRTRRTRLTLGAIMVAIAAIAIVLAAYRPLAPTAPRLADQVFGLATVQTGALLACLTLGALAALALMRQDEAG